MRGCSSPPLAAWLPGRRPLGRRPLAVPASLCWLGAALWASSSASCSFSSSLRSTVGASRAAATVWQPECPLLALAGGEDNDTLHQRLKADKRQPATHQCGGLASQTAGMVFGGRGLTIQVGMAEPHANVEERPRERDDAHTQPARPPFPFMHPFITHTLTRARYTLSSCIAACSQIAA